MQSNITMKIKIKTKIKTNAKGHCKSYNNMTEDSRAKGRHQCAATVNRQECVGASTRAQHAAGEIQCTSLPRVMLKMKSVKMLKLQEVIWA